MIPDSLRLAILLTVSHSAFAGGRLAISLDALQLQASALTVGLRAAITSGGQMVLPLAFGAFGAALGMLPMFWIAATVLGAGGGFAITRQRVR